MFLVDSHCHLDQLDLAEYNGSLDKALIAAKENHVGYMLCVCIDMNNFPAVLRIAEKYDNISASVGNHPNEKQANDPSVEELILLANNPKVIAIGETGLDYYRNQDNDMTWQQERFRRHIRAAKACNKPLIVHTRNAGDDTIRILQEENAAEVGGVLHCFTDTTEIAKQALDLNFYISFSGIITFKNAYDLQQVVKEIPLDRLLIETDSPYLAPLPYRGKPNQPAYVFYVADKMAELKQVSLDMVAAQTTTNFCTLFRTPIQL